MSKDRLRDSEGKYWEGKSSLEDEKYLKSGKDDRYFNSLKAAKEEKLKWSFEDFIHQAEEGKGEEIKTTKKKGLWAGWKYIGAAAALLVVGLFLLKSPEIEPIDEDSAVYVAQEPAEIKVPDSPAEEHTTVETEQKETFSTSQRDSGVEQKVEQPEPLHPRIEIIKESHVLVNGKPIYDDEEAEVIVLASLQLIADNFQEGREAVEKIKHLKIEL